MYRMAPLLLSFHQEDEGVIHVEELGVPELFAAEDAGVEGVPHGVQLQC